MKYKHLFGKKKTILQEVVQGELQDTAIDTGTLVYKMAEMVHEKLLGHNCHVKKVILPYSLPIYHFISKPYPFLLSGLLESNKEITPTIFKNHEFISE